MWSKNLLKQLVIIEVEKWYWGQMKSFVVTQEDIVRGEQVFRTVEPQLIHRCVIIFNLYDISIGKK